MNNLGYYNGEIGLIEEMRVPMTDRAFYFGDGVYDAVLCRNNIPYLLPVHMNRFYNNCRALNIRIPMVKEELSELICRLVKRVDSFEKFIYFHVSRGSALRSHTYEESMGNLCIMITPFDVGDVHKKIDTVTVFDNRYELCNYKTLNLLPGVMAAQYAKEKNCDEAIFVKKGIITEGSHCNVSIIKNGRIITHPESCRILSGVSRQKLLTYAKEFGVEVCEKEYGINELLSADEAVITSSGKIIRAIERVDGISIGGRAPALLSLFVNAMYNDYIEKTSVNSGTLL